MAKFVKYLFISIMYCTLSYAVTLTEEEEESIKLLSIQEKLFDTIAAKTKALAPDLSFNSWLNLDKKASLVQLNNLMNQPDSQWPKELFSVVFVVEEASNKMYIGEHEEVLKTNQFIKECFISAQLALIRRSTGLGLACKSYAHLVKMQLALDDLGDLQKAVTPVIGEAQTTVDKFFLRYQRDVEYVTSRFQADSTMTLGKFSEDFQQQFIKNKLIFDSCLYVYKLGLDAYANILAVNAHLYKKGGDSTLMELLPERQLDK